MWVTYSFIAHPPHVPYTEVSQTFMYEYLFDCILCTNDFLSIQHVYVLDTFYFIIINLFIVRCVAMLVMVSAFHGVLYTSFTCSSSNTCRQKFTNLQIPIVKYKIITLLPQDISFFSFKLVKKSTTLRHTPRTMIHIEPLPW